MTETLDQIDPDWIYSIDVLKDRASTVEYGSLGEQGVVLIGLKKGMLEKMPAAFSEKFKAD